MRRGGLNMTTEQMVIGIIIVVLIIVVIAVLASQRDKSFGLIDKIKDVLP